LAVYENSREGEVYMTFSVSECVECIILGFCLAGFIFYPLAAALAVVKAFKGN